MNQPDAPGPLEGVRIIEYGVFHAGPGATAILADMGADVIKIESGFGDPERFWTRVGKLNLTKPDGQSFMFEVSNRNKRGIQLDIKTDQGRRVLHRLVETADVFLTNLRKTTKTRYGLDYEHLKAINPRIIHASVSGYGPDGPMEDLGAFDPLGLARSGMMFVTGTEQPALIHLGVLDQATAITASHAILSALFSRERTGEGQAVHVSLYSTGLWLTYPNLMMYNAMGLDPTTAGDRSRHSPLRNAFCCRDGKWIIGTHHPEEKYWPLFCEATGTEWVLEDARFSTGDSRYANMLELVALYDEVFAHKTRDEWMDLFLPRGLMFSSVQTMEEVTADPQALANDYMVPFDHPDLGRFMVPGYPVHFSGSQAGLRKPAPKLGQHTREVLAEAGYSQDEIDHLAKEGVIN